MGHVYIEWKQAVSRGTTTCDDMHAKVQNYLSRTVKPEEREALEREIISHSREYMADLMVRHTSMTKLFNETIKVLPLMERTYIACTATPDVQEIIRGKVSTMAKRAWNTYNDNVKLFAEKKARGKEKPEFIKTVLDQISKQPALKLLSSFPGVLLAAKEYQRNATGGESLRFTAQELTGNKWDTVNLETSPYFQFLDVILMDSPKLSKILDFLRLVTSTKSEHYTITDELGNRRPADAQALCFTSSPVAAVIIHLFLRYRVNNPEFPEYRVARNIHPVLFTANCNSQTRRPRLLSIFNGFGDPKETRTAGKTEENLPDRIDWITTTTGCCGVGENIPRAKFVLLLEPPNGKHLEDQVLGRAVRAGDKENKFGQILHTTGSQIEDFQLELNASAGQLRAMVDNDWLNFFGLGATTGDNSEV